MSFKIFCFHKSINSYIDINFIQSGHLYKGSFLTGGFIDGSISLSYDINEKNSLYFSYILGYEGEGSWKIEKDIKEKEIKHSVLIEDHIIINNFWRIRPQIYFGWQRFKDNSLYSYDYHAYNNNVKGFGSSFDYFKDYNLSFYLNYRNVNYPNYTDLLSEIGYNIYSVKTGLYDKNIFEVGFRAKKNIWFLDFSYLRYYYLRQKVVSLSGEYSNKDQRDSEYNLVIGRDLFFKEFKLHPSLEFKFYSSNQNYIRYKSFFDFAPFFVKNAYSYGEYSLKNFFEFNYDNLLFNGNLKYTRRIYNSRPPRDVNNNYIIGKKQTQDFVVFSIELIKKILYYAYYKIGYSVVVSNSNNRFELYLPYNYVSHTFYFGYGIKY
ncbi:MAG: hypothetical protein N2446_03365 [Elusimicrobiales bacterium]|nr:hypothetical protein [Elusimicrobiales bacterium]